MNIKPDLKLYLLVQTAINEAESKYKEQIAIRIYNDFLNMPESIHEIMIEEYKDRPEDMAFEVALTFADYEYEMYAGELYTVPSAQDIDSVLDQWLIEYIKWKPKKTRQDEEVLNKIKEWGESSK